MQDRDRAKLNILELCSESEYGSWEFWSDKNQKTEEECQNIREAIEELVKEKKIIPLEYASIKDQTYKEVPLDNMRLGLELRKSMESDIDSEHFYWFMATDEGEQADLILRSK